jgi:hypothetical protein
MNSPRTLGYLGMSVHSDATNGHTANSSRLLLVVLRVKRPSLTGDVRDSLEIQPLRCQTLRKTKVREKVN